MRTIRQQFVFPQLLGMLIAVLILALLPIPGIRAIGQVTHPNDIFTEVYQAASPSVVGISVTAGAFSNCHGMADSSPVCV